ncbi:MAG: hypothetical protein RLZZ226_741 [Pseudomonadota bacterium]|jgi:hypothetical protein
MKKIQFFLGALLLPPTLIQADTSIPMGLWEVIGYPKSVQVSKNPATVKKNKSGTVNFSSDAATAGYEDNTLIMNICLAADNTWYEVSYGTQRGGWSLSGSNLTFSGNDVDVGSSGVLSIIDPNRIMSGDWQQWPLSAPATQQDIFSSLWTFKGATCL